jgi:hypothetical protein
MCHTGAAISAAAAAAAGAAVMLTCAHTARKTHRTQSIRLQSRLTQLGPLMRALLSRPPTLQTVSHRVADWVRTLAEVNRSNEVCLWTTIVTALA